MFGEDDLTLDRFIGGRLMISQPKSGYRAAMDPVLLAAACSVKAGESVLELGCGAGVASLCLGWRVAARFTGLELQPVYADLARRNAMQNGIDLDVVTGDLAQMPADLRMRSFDHVIANPPYFPPASGTKAADPGREIGQREETPLAVWVEQGMKRLYTGGWITMIQNADRLGDLLAALQAQGAGAITVLPIAPRAGRPAGRVIVQARKQARAPLQLLAPLILHSDALHNHDGANLTPQARAILRDGNILPLRR
jgi:tRNA1(Val) A37 N6-methylase TrmN6